MLASKKKLLSKHKLLAFHAVVFRGVVFHLLPRNTLGFGRWETCEKYLVAVFGPENWPVIRRYFKFPREERKEEGKEKGVESLIEGCVTDFLMAPVKKAGKWKKRKPIAPRHTQTHSSPLSFQVE